MRSSERKKNHHGWKVLAFRCAAVVGSTLIALVVAEIILRMVRPDLGELVHDVLERDNYRIFSNPHNVRAARAHPDTGEEILVLYNGLGSRQHREFEPQKPDGTTRIGVFGDSYTANVKMQAHYSFTEPLDFLLNASGSPTEVLNFGTPGYGTDQSYLLYQSLTSKLEFDTVIYVFCQNDLANNLANELLTIDESGELNYLPTRKPSLAVSILRNFYLTYFFIEVTSRDRQSFVGSAYQRDNETDHTDAYEVLNSMRADGYGNFRKSPKGEQSILLFSKIVSQWATDAAQEGQEFIVVLLPLFFNMRDLVSASLEQNRISTIDLREFVINKGIDPSSLRFQNDGHWNEEGNRQAALCLFGALSKKEAHPKWKTHSLLDYYYSALGAERVSSDRSLPTSPETAPSPPTGRPSIRSRYLELE